MKFFLFLVLHITLSAHAVSDKDIGGDLESKVLDRGQIKTDFFIDMEEGNVMDLTAQVLSAQESNGRPIPLTITVKDPDGRMDYHTDNKQLWVDLIVEGKLDPREIDKKFRIKKEKQYKDIHNGLINTMKSIERQHFSAIRHQNKRVHFTKRGEIRLAALKGMIDKWSVIHIITVCVVMCGQVFVLKGFFEIPASKSKI